MSQTLDLLDYRRQVYQQYARIRAANGSIESWETWRADRDRLFTSHPQSPVEDGATSGLEYFGFDPAWRLLGIFRAADDEEIVLSHSGSDSTGFRLVGTVDFHIEGRAFSLDVMWLDSYGGGLFLPFRDDTNGTSTYGGGRYLIDTVKGADLGHSGDAMVLDFNYAYHPSCVHSPRWSCPLAPPGNTIDIAVTAGERLPE